MYQYQFNIRFSLTSIPSQIQKSDWNKSVLIVTVEKKSCDVLMGMKGPQKNSSKNFFIKFKLSCQFAWVLQSWLQFYQFSHKNSGHVVNQICRVSWLSNHVKGFYRTSHEMSGSVSFKKCDVCEGVVDFGRF